jgi:hypothetical protein
MKVGQEISGRHVPMPDALGRVSFQRFLFRSVPSPRKTAFTSADELLLPGFSVGVSSPSRALLVLGR